MAQSPINADARRENIRALCLAAGVAEEDAARRLNRKIIITYNHFDGDASRFVEELIPILSRTLEVQSNGVIDEASRAAELVIGQVTERTFGPHVFVALRDDSCIISSKRIAAEQFSNLSVHPIKVLLAACYVAGAAIRCAVGRGIQGALSDDVVIMFDAFISPSIDLSATVDLGEAYLAGAGAIGNGFLWAARYARLSGHLHVVDDDMVSAGNLQRQIWFDDADIDKDKARTLCEKAQPFLAECYLEPSVTRLQAHKNRDDGPWLRRLLVAVDSRRARRHLQNELPGEVFDASTTGCEEIVLHYNRQPTNLACLGCIYYQNDSEITHEQAVAVHLGVDVEMVRKERIDRETANRICELHPHLTVDAIEGLAFDTLYKQLCGSGRLKTQAGKAVIAPFAFISVLAGVLLLLEVIRRQSGDEQQFTNDWRVNPWRMPVPEMRRCRPRRVLCECCGRLEIQRVNATLWHAEPSGCGLA